MTQTSSARRRDARIIRRFGDRSQSVLRRANTIREDLALYGSATVDASSLTAAGGHASGAIRQGAVFEVAGVAGSYAVLADAAAVNGRVALTFAPPLAISASDGAAVTFSQPYGEHIYLRMNGKQDELTEEEVQKGTKIRVLEYRPDAPEPEVGDLLDGLPITKVEPVDAGGGVSRYRCTVSPP
jgi:hypothetical protein